MNPQEEWQLSDDAPEIYERRLVPAMLGPLAAPLIERAALQPGERVLDIACGTGVVARAAARAAGPTGRVIGLDLNPGMLAVARARPPSAGAPMAWLQANAQDLPIRDASFNAALSSQGFQFFPDRPAALREIRRVLTPGGRLALSVIGSLRFNPVHALLIKALKRHVGPEAADILRGGFTLGDADDLHALIAGAEFHGVEIHPAEVWARFPSGEAYVRWNTSGSPMAGPVARADPEARERLFAEMSESLRPYLDDEGLTFPLRTTIGVGFR
ncbi:MAG: methyltransferase domain-containing protein [Nitrospinota bacterium]|jgi:SAM-dependent methyltransferase|nr:methyltransferase domain-containing protein [Nitrospinota bacterium]HJM43647.1 methyltransferase domain-containing protein [Nitrospinota bacterium]